MGKRLILISGVIAALSLGVACGDDDDDGTAGSGGTGATGGGGDGGGNDGFPQPAGSVAVSFSVDDTANKVFKAGELEWKGSFDYNETTRILSKDDAWMPPFPKLYDDGPWDKGGHEPKGATANDNKWGLTAFVMPPEEGTTAFEYGVIDATNQGWLWRGANGTFSVAAGATVPVSADGIALLAFGTTDLKLVIDKNALGEKPGGGAWDTSKITLKGSGWAWTEVELLDDGLKGDTAAADGKYTFIVSNYVGTGTDLPHFGLFTAGDKPEFVYVLNGVEYKNAAGEADETGVAASTKKTGAAFVDADITLAENKNTVVVIP